jgi:hypothetical protein
MTGNESPHIPRKRLTATTKTNYATEVRLPGVDWDENKNTINKAKHHGLSFEIAQYVFLDPQRIERRDESGRKIRAFPGAF